MNKTTMTFAMGIALAAVFAIASPLDVAVAQTTSDTMPDDGEKGKYKDGEGREYKDGKSCPNKEKKLASIEQSS